MADAALLHELGRRVARTRTGRNITQQQLAERAGVSRSTLTRIETGRGASLEHFVAVLRQLRALDGLEAILPQPEIRPSDLLRGSATPPRQRARPRGTSRSWGSEQ